MAFPNIPEFLLKAPMITWVKPIFPGVLEYWILPWSFWKFCQVMKSWISCLGKIWVTLLSPLLRSLMTIATSREKFWTSSGELNRVASQYLNNSCHSLWLVLKVTTTRGYRWIINFSVCKNKFCPSQNKSLSVAYCPNCKKAGILWL